MADKLTIDGLENYLKLRMVEVKQDLAEASEDDPNCFGAGYETGILAGLREVLAEIGGEEA